ncbi:MAG: diguanylate cyclase [Lachnospiraceae bacterium]|nr:diguanylate cyclase [Lachnospiraceae bacterium]
MGDRAIGKLSSMLLAEASESCRVYRIGGDEFVTITDNPSPEQMSKMAANILQQVQEANESEPFLFSVAVGYALGKGSDILTVVKAADERMYANKKRSKESQRQ